MRLFESAFATNSVQRSTLTRRPGARWASPLILVVFTGILASAVVSSSAVGQQSQSGSGQFRRRSTTGAGESSAIDSKLKGFLEKQAGIEQPQQVEQTPQRAARTQVRSSDSSSEPYRNTQQSSSALRSTRSATSVNVSRVPDQTDDREISHDGDESSPAIEQAAWEPKSDAASGSSAAGGSSLTGLRQSETISELQPTPSATPRILCRPSMPRTGWRRGGSRVTGPLR